MGRRAMDPTGPMANIFWACEGVSMPSKRLCESCFREASQSSQVVKEDINWYIKEAVQDSVKDLLPAPSRKGRSVHQTVQEDDSPKPGLVTSGSDVDSERAQD